MVDEKKNWDFSSVFITARISKLFDRIRLWTSLRSVELKSAVRTRAVVMIDVLVQHSLKVPPATNDHPVQAFTAGTSDPALGMGVGLGRL